MASKDPAKKVAKVAKSSRSKAVKQPRRLGFPLIVAAVVILGTTGVFLARNERESAADDAPSINVVQNGIASGDHWHMPYGLSVCTQEGDGFQAPLVDAGSDEVGIHTHGDGLIHVHPTSSAGRGRRATLEKFFDQVGIDAGDDEWTLQDGTTLANGDECADGSDGVWRVAKWDTVADDTADVFTAGFDRIRFRDDGEIYTFFFGPSDAVIPQPPSVGVVPDDVDPIPTDGDGNIIDLEDIPLDLGEIDDAPVDEAPADDAPAEDEAPATTSGE